MNRGMDEMNTWKHISLLIGRKSRQETVSRRRDRRLRVAGARLRGQLPRSKAYGFDSLTDGWVGSGLILPRLRMRPPTLVLMLEETSGTRQTQKNRSEHTRRIKPKPKSAIANYSAWAFGAEEKQDKQPASLEKVVKDLDNVRDGLVLLPRALEQNVSIPPASKRERRFVATAPRLTTV
ncbi:hypothetical protein FDENT_6727 [Fusarium denticulatum]|uniref:Uncharacterized protein n=1 Tax=Fusarium denticulatum TaxID=48507 RepID=A0A8H5X7P4_9HYPO|nr:hypothetical protein FDENT_6727 [Fusarium denticulatum]